MVNCLGQQVLDKSIEIEAGISTTVIDISSLKSGVYVVKAINDLGEIVSTNRLIVSGK